MLSWAVRIDIDCPDDGAIRQKEAIPAKAEGHGGWWCIGRDKAINKVIISNCEKI
jgi:hypothetical protein